MIIFESDHQVLKLKIHLAFMLIIEKIEKNCLIFIASSISCYVMQ